MFACTGLTNEKYYWVIAIEEILVLIEAQDSSTDAMIFWLLARAVSK